jgi:hypothetical protein
MGSNGEVFPALRSCNCRVIFIAVAYDAEDASKPSSAMPTSSNGLSLLAVMHEENKGARQSALVKARLKGCNFTLASSGGCRTRRTPDEYASNSTFIRFDDTRLAHSRLSGGCRLNQTVVGLKMKGPYMFSRKENCRVPRRRRTRTAPPQHS